MSETRTYTCLACEERPVFHGKIGAAMHLRSAHSSLLEHHHPDELLAEGPEYEGPQREGPFICIRAMGSAGECGQKRDTEEAMRSHVSAMHGIPEPEYGDQYVTVAQYAGDYASATHPLTPSQLATAEAFGQVMKSVDTVGDFLTECRA